MHFPKMNRSRQSSITIPQLNGGLNLQDSLSMVNDNQLTDCCNMWYHRGALRTRPGLCFVQEISQNSASPVNRLQQTVDEKTVLAAEFNLAGDTQYVFGVAEISSEDISCPVRKNAANYYVPMALAGEMPTAFGTKTKEGLLYFLSSGDIISSPRTDTGYGDWSKKEPYIPTVMMNGYGVEAEASEDSAASMYEDYNMLTRAFKCQYTTDGKSRTFILPTNELGTAEDGNRIAVVELLTYDENEGVVKTHTVTLYKNGMEIVHDPVTLSLYEFATEQGYTTERYSKDARLEITMNPDGRTIRLTTWVEPNESDGVPSGQYIIGPAIPRVVNNNLTITAWRAADWSSQRDTICQMTQCTWFGGDRSGLTAGTRLFVCGNPDNPNLIHWSSTNDPLFFPEQNHAYVGDDMQKLTGLGKQGELLFLFKERKIYATQYVAGDDDDYEFAKASGVAIDTYTAKFPITPIHSYIGCDCPESIRLVNNRLVWLNSSGRVFMLTAANQYSEQNVRELSPNIRPRLRQHSKTDLQGAIAGELEGYYLLLVKNVVYLLDSQSSAFTSFGYYSNEEKAQKALPWFAWELPSEYAYTAMLADGNEWLLVGAQPAEGGKTNEYLLCGKDGEQDVTGSISCSFTTKLFDFGNTDIRKAIEQLYLDVADTAGGNISVGYITEHGIREDACTITTRGDSQERESGHMRTVRLTPNINRVRLFGLQLCSEGGMAVENILLKMRRQGVVR